MPKPNEPSMANFEGHADMKSHMAQLAKRMIGQTIVDVRWQDDDEMSDNMWEKRAPVIVLSNGDTIIAMRDDEGNDAGALQVMGGTFCTS